MLPTLLASDAAKGLPTVITIRTAVGISRAASRHNASRLQPTRLTGSSVAVRRRVRSAQQWPGHVSFSRPNVAPSAPAADIIAERGQEAAQGNCRSVSGPHPGKTTTRGGPPPRRLLHQSGAAVARDGMSMRPRPSRAGRLAEGGLTSRSLAVIASPAGSETCRSSDSDQRLHRQEQEQARSRDHDPSRL